MSLNAQHTKPPIARKLQTPGRTVKIDQEGNKKMGPLLDKEIKGDSLLPYKRRLGIQNPFIEKKEGPP